MKNYLLYTCLLVSNYSFIGPSVLKAVSYKMDCDYVTEDMGVTTIPNEVKIFMYENIRIYETYTLDSLNKVSKTEHYIISDSSATGLLYINSEAKPKKFKSDEFMEGVNLGPENYNTFRHDFGKAEKIDTLKDKNKVVYRYLIERPDGTGKDSVYNYFDKGLLDFPFSLSPVADNREGTKLFRQELVRNPRTQVSGGKTYKISRLRMSYEWKPLEISNKEKYMRLFERFKKDRKNNDFQ